MISPEISAIISKFNYIGEPVAVKRCNNGHINGTYFIDCESGRNKQRYVLQSINTSVFKQPDHVMENVIKVTDHIKKKLALEGKDTVQGTINIVFTKDGRYSFVDESGNYWRSYIFVEGNCYQSADSPELMERVGRAFGHFQRQLSDFDASALYESLPDFHNTVSRFADFERSLSDDRFGRAETVKEDVKFILDRKDKCSFIMDGIAKGELPLRVTHNDTKLNNIMMDPETGEGRCVIDLDTVMPGSVLSDFGDAIRFGASSAAEDETDLDKVYLRLDLFEGFVKGFLEGLEGTLIETEIRALPMGAFILTLEQAIRFLGDYLNGDVYFRTDYPGHNIDRARNQMKLVADIECKMEEMNRIIEKYI